MSRTTAPPEPTHENPLAQLVWIFHRKASQYDSTSSKESYYHALSFYKEYWEATSAGPEASAENSRFYIGRHWTPDALIRVKRWTEDNNIQGEEGYRASTTLVGIFSALRKTMNYAYRLGLISTPVSNVILSNGVRETNARTAYTEDELADILEVISPMAQFAKGLLKPYEPTGVGKDPRRIDRKGIPAGQKLEGQGWKCKKNAVWYFEQEMNCEALPNIEKHRKKHEGFFSAATNKHGGLNKFYRELGVTSLIGPDVILPLMVELIAETGLNVESVLTLQRDCFQEEHPLTGQPYLKYYKGRSSGEMELHPSLYDAQDSDHLKPEQSQIIRRTIDVIRRLTKPLARKAKVEDSDYLFLYQSRAPYYFGQVRRISTSVLSTWTQRIVKEHRLINRNGNPLSFNLSRFRPTRITKAVREGKDIFRVQALAGHKNFRDTLRYLDKHNLSFDFQREMTEALENIKSNANEQREDPLPKATESDAEPGDFIFEGPISSCKNPYDPPQEVQDSQHYSEGDACTYWNQCLFCENIIITKNSLPKLIAYRQSIETALKGRVRDIPRMGELYRRAASVIDSLLDIGTFEEKEIEWATEVAENESEEVLDGFIFQGVAT